MEKKFLYFDVKHALDVHDIVLRESGGLAGIQHKNAIESILHHIQDDRYYPDFEDKLTHLVFSFVKNHVFTDGNKRTSIALGAYFLNINGLDSIVTNFIEAMENIVVWVAENKISKELLRMFIISLISEEEYPEELKLQLVEAAGRE